MAAYAEFGCLFEERFVDHFRQDVVRVLNDEHTDVIVAELDGALAGTITLYPDGQFYDERVPPQWACLRLLSVAPEARGNGVGKALMEECLSRARRLGSSRVLLHTLPFMTAAIALHESLGFKRAPEIDVDYSGVTAIAYLLDLTPDGNGE